VRDSTTYCSVGRGTAKVSNEIGRAKFRSRSDHVAIQVFDDAANVIEAHEHKVDFKERINWSF